MLETFSFILKGLILTEVLTRATRTWGIFDALRTRVKKLDFLRRLLDCFECTSVWVAFPVLLYLLYFEFRPFTYFMIFVFGARWINTLYEYLDALRAKKEGEL